MGKRAVALGVLLAKTLESGPNTPRPSADSIAAAGLADDVQRVYRQLGGTQPTPRVRPGGWDFSFDGWTLELDEENHFNRYREITLDAPAYRRLASAAVEPYREYCTAFEHECSTHGGYWVNDSASREFGPAGHQGVLDGDGSPRWKQRAFYDYVKDLAPLTDGIRVSRLAIWDTVSVDGESASVGEVLERAAAKVLRRTAWSDALLELIEARTVAAL